MEKTIYSSWLCAELIRKGFEIKYIKPNPRYPQFDCWVFDKTDAFIKAFGEISQKRK